MVVNALHLPEMPVSQKAGRRKIARQVATQVSLKIWTIPGLSDPERGTFHLRLWGIGCAVLFALLAGSVLAQAPMRMTFDVTSVRPTAPERLYNLKFEKCTNGGPFIAAGTPLQWVVNFAYAGPEIQVSGGPPWLGSFDAAYDVIGKPDHAVTEAECRAMVQSLLEDRFNLKVHREVKEVAAYALTVGKHGHKLQPAKPLEAGGGVRVNGALQRQLPESEAPDGWSMSYLASVVSDFVGRPVVDRTNLPGKYSFSIRFAHTEDSDDPVVAVALEEQLGLKLESIRMNQNRVVIDRIEKPNPN